MQIFHHDGAGFSLEVKLEDQSKLRGSNYMC